MSYQMANQSLLQRSSHRSHATVTTLRSDLAKEAEQIQEMNRIIGERGFAEVPGFVSGLWTLDREKGEVVIIHSFDSLQSAESFAAHNRNSAARQAEFGMELLSIRVNEILATA
jgi:hypothetical protein